MTENEYTEWWKWYCYIYSLKVHSQNFFSQLCPLNGESIKEVLISLIVLQLLITRFSAASWMFLCSAFYIECEQIINWGSEYKVSELI